MKHDFKKIVNIIFTNKSNYKEVNNKDKNDSFFIINRKFGYKYIKRASFLNSKFVDKACALDVWYRFFRNVKAMPQWYWKTSVKKNQKEKNISKPDRDLLLNNTNLKDEDIDFLYKYYPDKINYEIKKLKRLNKK